MVEKYIAIVGLIVIFTSVIILVSLDFSDKEIEGNAHEDNYIDEDNKK